MFERGWPDPEVCIASTGDLSHCLNAGGMGWQDYETETLISIQNATRGQDQNGIGISEEDVMYTLDQASQHAVAISANQRGEVRERPVHGSLSASKSGKQFDGIVQSMAVRRLTPRECERLQGFPDDYTLVPTTIKKRIEAAELARLRALTHSQLAAIFSVDPDTFTGCTDADLQRLAADGSRYKALGNSMAVPVMRWIGGRIQMMEQA
jgi:DNA (cytosine-5)-methyltransferase 1